MTGVQRQNKSGETTDFGLISDKLNPRAVGQCEAGV